MYNYDYRKKRKGKGEKGSKDSKKAKKEDPEEKALRVRIMKYQMSVHIHDIAKIFQSAD